MTVIVKLQFLNYVKIFVAIWKFTHMQTAQRRVTTINLSQSNWNVLKILDLMIEGWEMKTSVKLCWSRGNMDEWSNGWSSIAYIPITRLFNDIEFFTKLKHGTLEKLYNNVFNSQFNWVDPLWCVRGIWWQKTNEYPKNKQIKEFILVIFRFSKTFN